ncbi:hypothetical protein Bca52824_023527 [Brassica carinata]|uniref:Uncharacterized protein n=1 Tax=Brassica carinata TaxID=52824 RepID=A0A8X7VJ83_BRACI|nr:hypothetical protein Bca52824_023527 [Brassica carinata]
MRLILSVIARGKRRPGLLEKQQLGRQKLVDRPKEAESQVVLRAIVLGTVASLEAAGPAPSEESVPSDASKEVSRSVRILVPATTIAALMSMTLSSSSVVSRGSLSSSIVVEASAEAIHRPLERQDQRPSSALRLSRGSPITEITSASSDRGCQLNSETDNRKRSDPSSKNQDLAISKRHMADDGLNFCVSASAST